MRPLNLCASMALVAAFVGCQPTALLADTCTENGCTVTCPGHCNVVYDPPSGDCDGQCTATFTNPDALLKIFKEKRGIASERTDLKVISK